MQHQHLSKDSERSQDARVKVTPAIWGCAIGMLALCIPLAAVTESGPVLPILVIVGAALATAAVWAGEIAGIVRGSDNAAHQQKIDELNAHIKELEERLSNVETIDRFEHHLAEKSLGSSQQHETASLISE